MATLTEAAASCSWAGSSSFILDDEGVCRKPSLRRGLACGRSCSWLPLWKPYDKDLKSKGS